MNEERWRDRKRQKREQHTKPSAVSLFSGGGGLDLGFDQAGFDHVASCDVLPQACATLSAARPGWKVHCGDLRDFDWRACAGADVVHGGPPCTPYSAAGRQLGADDDRDMLPAFVDAVLAITPRAFVMEQVPAVLSDKFAAHVGREVGRLEARYAVARMILDAAAHGVPQHRLRVFLVGFADRGDAARFAWPRESDARPGARASLGLAADRPDRPAPTLRSGLTGPRHTTSVLSSSSAARTWRSLGIWPNGVQPTRAEADAVPAPDGTYRLCVADCMRLQGFPADWPFQGPIYMRLGLLGNSVPPPLARAVAGEVAAVLGRQGAAWPAA